MELIDHLFRRESVRMVATLTRIFGLQHLALAEDVVQDAFCRAAEVWSIRGLPPNPEAWLLATAKRRAIDVLRRERTAKKFAPELASEWSLAQTVEEAFTPPAIRDDQLRLMFSCCDPSQPEEAQIALVLNLLCGFRAREVAAAFLISLSAAEKRLFRAKQALIRSGLMFDLSSQEVIERLAVVHRSLYLLFNEGYHSGATGSPIRQDLCSEAIRLSTLLLESQATATPTSYALAASMRLHAARLPSRLDAQGDLVALGDQDRTSWNRELIHDGFRLLEASAKGVHLSEYHLEAMIAAVHAEAASLEETDWSELVRLYDFLIRVRPTPVVALNRAIAVGHVRSPTEALRAIEAIEEKELLETYPFYWAALAEMQQRAGRAEEARRNFRQASAQARNEAEQRFWSKKAAAVS